MEGAIENIRRAIDFVVPELVLVAAACGLFLGGAFRGGRTLWGGAALVALFCASLLWWLDVPVPPGDLTASLFRNDPLAWLTKGLALAGGVVLVLSSWRQISDRFAAEYHACLLLIVAGASLVGAANDLVSLFLSLELVSIPTYVLLYLPRLDRASQEASAKYFFLSVFSSALLLYGFSFLYGAVGSTNLEVIRAALRESSLSALPATFSIALVMVLAGLGFRITAAPFHFYAPDVYQGAPTVGAALLAYIPKVVGFVALIQVISATLLAATPDLRVSGLPSQAAALIWILALVSMFVGNLLGLLQDNLKRLLAYSSIAHAGYMLVGLGAGQQPGVSFGGLEAMLFYLIAYGAMTVGAFAVLALLSTTERPVERIDDLAGLGRSHPLTALLRTVFLFSLTGLPPTAGFWGKLYLFFAAWSTQSRLYQILAVVMAINAAIGAWYYLKIVAAMYLRQAVKELPDTDDRPGLIAVTLCAALTLLLFLLPQPARQLAAKAAAPPRPAVDTGELAMETK